MSLIVLSYFGLWVLLSIITIELVPTEARGTGNGLKGLFGSIGATTGLILTSIISYFFSLAVAFLLFSFLLLINLPFIYKYIIETKGADLSTISYNFFFFFFLTYIPLKLGSRFCKNDLYPSLLSIVRIFLTNKSNSW